MLKPVSSIGPDLDHLEADRNIPSDPLDYRKRRTIRLIKKNESWGFTIQVRLSCIQYYVGQAQNENNINRSSVLGGAFEVYLCKYILAITLQQRTYHSILQIVKKDRDLISFLKFFFLERFKMTDLYTVQCITCCIFSVHYVLMHIYTRKKNKTSGLCC